MDLGHYRDHVSDWWWAPTLDPVDADGSLFMRGGSVLIYVEVSIQVITQRYVPSLSNRTFRSEKRYMVCVQIFSQIFASNILYTYRQENITIKTR